MIVGTFEVSAVKYREGLQGEWEIHISFGILKFLRRLRERIPGNIRRKGVEGFVFLYKLGKGEVLTTDFLEEEEEKLMCSSQYFLFLPRSPQLGRKGRGGRVSSQSLPGGSFKKCKFFCPPPESIFAIFILWFHYDC